MEKFLRFILLLFVCGKSLSLSGSDGKIIVWLQDGNNVVLRINEMPEFQYTDGSIIVYNGKTIHKWPLEKVQKFTFENIVSDIGHVHTDKYETKVDVYTLQGRIVARRLPVAQIHKTLSRGVYIIDGKKVVIR